MDSRRRIPPPPPGVRRPTSRPASASSAGSAEPRVTDRVIPTTPEDFTTPQARATPQIVVPKTEPPQSSPSHKKVPAWVKILTAVILVATAGYLYYRVVYQPRRDFVQQYETITVIRNLPGLAITPDWDEVVTPQMVRRISREGHGLKAALVSREDGKTKERREEILVKSELADPGIRNQALDQGRERLERLIEQFNSVEVAAAKYLVFVDSSSGDPRLLEEQLTRHLNPELVSQKTSKGYEVRVLFHRLGGNPFYNLLGPVIIRPNSSSGDGQNDIESKRDEIIGDLHEEERSEIIFGLLNSMFEDGTASGDHVLVFSDGLEYSRFFKWETGTPADVAEKDSAAILEKMEKAVPNFPNLTGVTIDWYFPNRPEKAEMMMAVSKIWKKLLTKHGANFQEHF